MRATQRSLISRRPAHTKQRLRPLHCLDCSGSSLPQSELWGGEINNRCVEWLPYLTVLTVYIHVLYVFVYVFAHVYGQKSTPQSFPTLSFRTCLFYFTELELIRLSRPMLGLQTHATVLCLLLIVGLGSQAQVLTLAWQPLDSQHPFYSPNLIFFHMVLAAPPPKEWGLGRNHCNAKWTLPWANFSILTTACSLGGPQLFRP